jgi:hypothetical protein
MRELADFFVNALRRAGALVDLPTFDHYDVLLPEELADRWQVPAFQRLTFAQDPTAVSSPEDVTAVGYGHPLLETLVEETRTEPACIQAFVHSVRTDKRGLFPLARQALAFPNARLSQVPRQSEVVAVCHYARFNFKAALITDEKREQLVSVVMDVQAGFAVPELASLERLVQLEEEPALDSHLPAPVRWLPGQAPLSRPVLDGLLERAVEAALQELAAPLAMLRRRAARYLELDRARLNEYYGDIARDLRRRLDRASDLPQDQVQRRVSLEDKLAAALAEREVKLADVEAKYRPRVELALMNLQIIHQPKVLLPVQIGTRSTVIERTVVWDPLLHRVEPLACDVCGRSATRLVLCSGGHLAHEHCLLAEQCVDCKRLYCRLCTAQMSRCVVCERPVCVPSLNRCADCGRATCREHVGLCHAAAGQPVHLAPPPAPELPEQEPPARVPLAPLPAEPEVKERPAPRRSQGKARPVAKPKPAPKRTPRPAERTPARPTPSKIEVYVESEAPVVNAFVLTKGAKKVAVRSWEWTDRGIVVTCLCELGWACPVNGRVLKTEGGAGIEAQIKAQIEDLRRDYGVPARRVLYFALVRGLPQQVPRLTLPAEWKTKQG